MKKSPDFQTLFNDLPISLIDGHPVEEEEASFATVANVLTQTRRKAHLRTAAVKRRRVAWLIPLVACLTAFAVITVAAIAAYRPSVPDSFPVPTVTQGGYFPLVSDYAYANDVNTVAVDHNVTVTLDKYTVDPVDARVRFLLQVSSDDGLAFSEHTASYMSVLTLAKFRNLQMTDVDTGKPLDGYTGVFRVDNAADPTKATFEGWFEYSGDGNDLLGRTLTLQMTDYLDYVFVSHDLSFTFESADALYNALTPAKASDYTVTDAYHRSLPATKQRVSFSLEMEQAYIDNIGFCEVDGRSVLCISYSGLKEEPYWPCFLDTRTGYCHYGDVAAEENASCWQVAKQLGYTDKNRVTVCYPDVTKDDLPYLFMMADGGTNYVVRAKGTWELPFAICSTDAMPTDTYAVDLDITRGQYQAHLSDVSISDGSLYFEGTYETVDLPEGTSALANLYGAIDLVLADGTVLKNYVGKDGAQADIPQIEPPAEGTCRFGGEFRDFIDHTQIVALIVNGQTVTLPVS